jgi:hypothetical protein
VLRSSLQLLEFAQDPLRDYFNNLRDLGFDFHEREVDRDVAKEAWSRLRTAFYELRATRLDPIGGEVPWAEREFGNPDYPV